MCDAHRKMNEGGNKDVFPKAHLSAPRLTHQAIPVVAAKFNMARFGRMYPALVAGLGAIRGERK
jgi:hypothetical protein